MENLIIYLDARLAEVAWNLNENAIWQAGYITAVIDLVEANGLDRLPQEVADAISKFRQ